MPAQNLEATEVENVDLKMKWLCVAKERGKEQ
jgi:hypothetical protein